MEDPLVVNTRLLLPGSIRYEPFSVISFRNIFMKDRKIREWEEEGEANAAQIICVHVSRNIADRSNKSEFITDQIKAY